MTMRTARFTTTIGDGVASGVEVRHALNGRVQVEAYDPEGRMLMLGIEHRTPDVVWVEFGHIDVGAPAPHVVREPIPVGTRLVVTLL